MFIVLVSSSLGLWFLFEVFFVVRYLLHKQLEGSVCIAMEKVTLYLQ